MIILKNLTQNAIPAIFDTAEDFIKYTVNEAVWLSLPTGEIPTMEKWNFRRIFEDAIINDYGEKDILYSWKAELETCLNFWTKIVAGKWEIRIV